MDERKPWAEPGVAAAWRAQALADRYEFPIGSDISALTEALRATRDDALEEAARLADSPYYCRTCGLVCTDGISPADCVGHCSLDGMDNERLAAAIRALKVTP